MTNNNLSDVVRYLFLGLAELPEQPLRVLLVVVVGVSGPAPLLPQVPHLLLQLGAQLRLHRLPLLAGRLHVPHKTSVLRIRRIHMFLGLPGSESGSIGQRHGSGSCYHQAKMVRKTLIPTVL
jgi:hypothetical protein